MRWARIILAVSCLVLLGAGLVLLARAPARLGASGGGGRAAGTATAPQVLHLGLIPERNIIQQREAYSALAERLGKQLGCEVELVTNASYVGVLDDFRNGAVDVAFLGSLVTVLAVDRMDTQVVLKSESGDGKATYSGVVFVPEGSPITSFAELKGKTLGAVRTTTAGPLFGVYQKTLENSFDSPESLKFVWSGTHDDVIEEVLAGKVAAGAVKDVRLESYLLQHSGVKVRRLAESKRVPDNALVVSQKVPAELKGRIAAALLTMNESDEGRQVLGGLGLARFVACSIEEYGPLYDMIEAIGDGWGELQIPGSPPVRKRGVGAETRHEGGNWPRMNTNEHEAGRGEGPMSNFQFPIKDSLFEGSGREAVQVRKPALQLAGRGN